MNDSADFWIRELNLQPHPEGGYFREAYRSEEKTEDLPERYNGARCFATSIYFLVKADKFSAFHRIKSDETWHFYSGSPLKVYILHGRNEIQEVLLGKDPFKKEVLQYTIRRGEWFAAKAEMESGFSLTGCTVAPSFEFDDFEMGEYEKLSVIFPSHTLLLKKFCIR